MIESDARDMAQRKVKETEWARYINPNWGVFSIKRALIEPFAEAAGVDFIDAMSGLASIAHRHLRRMIGEGWHFGQSEELLHKPIRAALHTLLMDGKVYLSDEQFHPYF